MTNQPSWLAGTEFTSETADVGGVTLHYVRGGSGPTMVLLHGFPQDCYEWRAVMPRLATTYTVVAVDLRGVGESDAPADGYDAAGMAADVRTPPWMCRCGTASSTWCPACPRRW